MPKVCKQWDPLQNIIDKIEDLKKEMSKSLKIKMLVLRLLQKIPLLHLLLHLLLQLQLPLKLLFLKLLNSTKMETRSHLLTMLPMYQYRKHTSLMKMERLFSHPTTQNKNAMVKNIVCPLELDLTKPKLKGGLMKL